MKIAINTRLALSGKMAGEGYYIYSLLQQFALRGSENEYHLIFDRPFDRDLFEFLNNKPNFHLHVIGPVTRVAPLMDYWFQVSIKKFLDKNKVDLFFSPEPYTSLLTGTKCIITIHDLAFIPMPWITYFVNSLNARVMVRASANRADKIISVSHSTSNDIKKYYGINEKKIEIIHHGIKNIKNNPPMNKTELRSILPSIEEKYILYVGTIEPRKNLGRLIHAYKLLRADGVTHSLVIAGRKGWKNKDVFKTVIDEGLSGHVIFTGYVDDSMLTQLYLNADIFVYVPLYEGFGMPVSEAMSCGIPVVTSNIPSISEIIGDAGVMVDPTSTDSIYKGLKMLIEDENERNRMGKLLKQRSTMFSWNTSAMKHLEVFRTMNE